MILWQQWWPDGSGPAAPALQEISSNLIGITGEASSNTFTSARGVYLRGPTMDKAHINVTISDLIREAQPYQRQIVIFRDPVERYQSAFYYYRCVCVGGGGSQGLGPLTWRSGMPAGPVEMLEGMMPAGAQQHRSVYAGCSTCATPAQPVQSATVAPRQMVCVSTPGQG